MDRTAPSYGAESFLRFADKGFGKLAFLSLDNSLRFGPQPRLLFSIIPNGEQMISEALFSQVGSMVVVSSTQVIFTQETLGPRRMPCSRN